MSSLAPVLSQIDAGRGAALERLIAFLRIPSISTDPARRDETRRAGQWVSDRLAEIGFAVHLHDTPGHPIVLGHHPGPDDRAPHILYYGHYDVQPPDPLELWQSPPFEPAIVEGPHGRRIVARGAVDDKGQTMTFIEALRAWKAVHGGLPVAVTVLCEGEEECGSPSLPAFLDQHRKALSAEICVVSDTGMWDVHTPAITTRLRGNVYTEITLEGPNRDLHSGLYGGAVLNPINALVRILGDLHDEHGRCRLPGFYDRVREPEDDELAAWQELAFDEAAFLRDIGLNTPTGEAGRGALMRLWARPTADIAGIWGGYTGPGSKTVIASKASAKLSFRIVPDQEPAEVVAALDAFLEERRPADARITVRRFGASRGLSMPTDSPWLAAARTGLERVFSRPPALIGSGGSIPVVGMLKSTLDLDSLLVGFGLEDDRVHSPNEKFELVCFENGMRAHAAMLAEFARRSR